MKIVRNEHKKAIQKLFQVNQVVAILGPRQCGKTTIAKTFLFSQFFDLENPEDLQALENPNIALKSIKGLIVIDEIQRRPELFSILRHLVDADPKKRFLILGSASRDLIRQSSETLAGRISYYHLSGFNLSELKVDSYERRWIRGGFPKSYMAKNVDLSTLWLEDYIRTYLERDIPQLGIQIPATTLRKFWSMLCHYHGQIINYSELGKNFGISDHTAKKYVDILAGTFMVTVVQPWIANLAKRQVKSPKLYISDTGIFHHFISIDNYKSLIGHPKVGASWESLVLAELKSIYRGDIYFWNIQSGAELDFYIEYKGKKIGIECKFTDAPKMTPSISSAIVNLKLDSVYIVYPGVRSYSVDDNVFVISIKKIKQVIA
jgi:predicted AAA+ superfamily ATPase